MANKIRFICYETIDVLTAGTGYKEVPKLFFFLYISLEMSSANPGCRILFLWDFRLSQRVKKRALSYEFREFREENQLRVHK